MKMKHDVFYALCDKVHQGSREEALAALKQLETSGATVVREGDQVAILLDGIAKHLTVPQAPAAPEPPTRKKTGGR